MKGNVCTFQKSKIDSLISQCSTVHNHVLEKMTIWRCLSLLQEDICSKTIHSIDNREFMFTVVLIIRPWDPGIVTATTWGEVVFRGSGNVMTQRWAKGSPKAIEPGQQIIAQPRPKHPLHRARLAIQGGQTEIESESGHPLPPAIPLGGRFRRAVARLLGSNTLCACSRPGGGSPVATGRYKSSIDNRFVAP
jgi:hypothetical protein